MLGGTSPKKFALRCDQCRDVLTKNPYTGARRPCRNLPVDTIEMPGQGLVGFDRQIVFSKRFVDKIDTTFKHTSMSYDIAGVAGHVEDFYLGPTGVEMIGQIPTAHPRHDDVGEEKVKAPFIFCG